jgi:hypothetical protein
MKSAHPIVDNKETEQESRHCAECGWPGVGNMPAGVKTVNHNGSQMLIGQLSYFRIQTKLCSICQEMRAAVQSRPWFVNAHGEYLKQIRMKKKLLAGR